MTEFIRKSFNKPDSAQEYIKVKTELVNIGGIAVYRMTFAPGWNWPESMSSDFCTSEHLVWLVISGRFAVRMNDGRTEEFGPGDIGMIPPGHNAWVIGDEPVVAIDIETGGIKKDLLRYLLEEAGRRDR